MRRHKTAKRVSCGNAGAVESVESQKQASPSFHEPLGNLAQRRRDSHIPTAPATKADGKVENQKQVSHFPTASIPLSPKEQNRSAGGLRPPPPTALRSASVVPFYSAVVGNFLSALDTWPVLASSFALELPPRTFLPALGADGAGAPRP